MLQGREAGSTLIETLVVLGMMVVLMGIALPSMSSMITSYRALTLVNAFLSSLNFARSEAIKRNSRAVLCKSVDGLSCAEQGGWEQGWLLFHDVNNNAELDAGETVIERQGAVSGGLRLTGNTPVASYVSYSASGSAKLTSGAFQAGTFTLCRVPDAGAEVRTIVLSSTGRARTTKGVAGDCD